MSSNFERSQLTKIMISSAPVTAETLDSASYLGLSCTIKEVQFTAGQKQDIDVTTLCSVEQENINGHEGALQKWWSVLPFFKRRLWF
ncbi:phage major tail protein [Escherichia coli UMNK88]|nr:phage major tail protein [Escherichia coli UMNK88]